MAIQLSCSACGNRASVPDDLQGQQVKCLECGAALLVPATSPPATGSFDFDSPKPSASATNRAKAFVRLQRQFEGNSFPFHCPQCGTVVELGIRVAPVVRKCPGCGSEITTAAIDSQVEAMEEQQRQAQLEPVSHQADRQRVRQSRQAKRDSERQTNALFLIAGGAVVGFFLVLVVVGVVWFLLSRPATTHVAEHAGTQSKVAPTQRPKDSAPETKRVRPDPEPNPAPAEKTIDDYRAALKKGSAQARAEAAAALGDLGADATGAVPDLIRASDDKDARVRVAAIKALGQVGGPANAAVSGLVGSLLDPVPEVRLAAVDALEAIGLPGRGDIGVLKTAGESKNLRVRRYVMEVLGKIPCDPQDVLPVVVAAAKDPDASLRLAAIRTWGKLGAADKKGSLNGLLAILKQSSDAAEATACVEALENLGPLTAAEIPTLEAALQEKSVTIRRFAASSLGKIGQDAKPAVAPLRQALKDEDVTVRQAAFGALANLGPIAVAARPDLLEALKRRGQRSAAAEALLRTGPDAALAPTWIELLKDDDPDVFGTAIKAIDQLGKLPKASLRPLIDTLKTDKPAVRVCAASALGNMEKEGGLAVTDLMKLLQDRDVDVQKSAVTALGKIGPDSGVATPQLIAFLKNKQLHDPAVEALAKIGRGAVPDLVQVLKTDDLKQPQKLDVIGILKEIGPEAKDAVKVLVAITKSFDELPSIRKAARAALDKIEAK
jgi:HEAT repeat protein/DNA-directed RNA polymerase subunit RPC12/RpoP